MCERERAERTGEEKRREVRGEGSNSMGMIQEKSNSEFIIHIMQTVWDYHLIMTIRLEI